MSRTTKLYQRLEVLEGELMLRLRDALIEVLDSGYCWIFDSPERTPIFNTWTFKRPERREILDLVKQIGALRMKIGEPANVGIVGRYEHWARHHFSEDENRLGPKRIAEVFLAEIDMLQAGSID